LMRVQPGGSGMRLFLDAITVKSTAQRQAHASPIDREELRMTRGDGMTGGAARWLKSYLDADKETWVA
jgi:hypothetical protein